MEEVERLRTPTRGARGSPVEAAAAWWSLAKLATRKKKAKRRRKKKLPRGGTRPRMVLPGRRLQRNAWFDSGTFLRQSARSSSVRGTLTLFLRPLVSGSFCFFASPAECTMWNFLGNPFRKCSHIQRFLVGLWIHFASVHIGFWVTSHRSYVKVDSDPAVRSLCLFTPAVSAGEVAALVVDNSGTAGFAGYDAPRAVLAFLAGVLLVVGRPKLFGVMVDVDRKPCTSLWRFHRCSSWLY